MKKLKYLIGTICIMLFAATPISAEMIVFSDITGHWAEDNIYYMADKGILNGYTDGTFLPDNQITRGEFVTILAKDAAKDGKIDLKQFNYPSQFKDVNSHWAKAAINWASSVKVVEGYENKTFKPNAKITREELATMLNRHISLVTKLPPKNQKDPFNDDKSISSWAKDAVYNMQISGVINGKENHMFAPKTSATRGETATMVARYLRIVNGDSNSSATAALYFNNTLVQSQLPMENKESITMVPYRLFFESLNCEVEFHQGTSLVTAFNHEKDVEMWLGKTIAYADGSERTLSAAPYISNGSTMVPLIDAGTAMGLSVVKRNWGSSDQAIVISMTPTMVDTKNDSFYGTSTGNSPSGEINMEKSPHFLGTATNGAMTYGGYKTNGNYLYFGTWANNQPDGLGRSINSLGELSVGTFKDGHFSKGITYFADGSVFNGEWYYNPNTSTVYPGKGTLTANGATYGSNNTNWSGGALAQSNW
ncbi:MAG: S-layer homology domain-containing protein [Clostridiales bacterium]